MENLFNERVENNMNEEEKKLILENFNLFKKCYLLGVLDRTLV